MTDQEVPPRGAEDRRPALALPAWMADAGAVLLAGAALLALVAAAVFALSLPRPSSIPLGGGLGSGSLRILPPTFGFTERLAAFTNDGATLVTAVMLAGAVIAVVVLGRDGDPPARKQFRQIVALAIAVLAGIVTIADLIMLIDVATATTPISGIDMSTNKVAAVLGLLAPALLAAGVGWFALVWRQSVAQRPVDEEFE
ncbi:MAG: hypothetical protein ACRDYY_17305 [Acidimicrobiales bacterium]